MIVFNKIESWRHLDHIAWSQDVRKWVTIAAGYNEISLRFSMPRDVWLAFLVLLQASVDLAGEKVVLGQLILDHSVVSHFVLVDLWILLVFESIVL